MQPNKTKLALQIGAVVLGALCASNSYADTFTAQVTTVDDVVITERQALAFGENIFTTAGTTCVLGVGAGGTATAPGSVLMNYTDTLAGTPGAQGANYGLLSGDGCVVGAGAADGVTPGIWDVTGLAGGAVSILVTEIAQTDAAITYEPSGCVVVYDGTTGAGLDDCDALASGGVVSGQFADNTAAEDETVGPDTGTSTEGQFSFAVGGTISIVSALVAENPYDVQFQIDITY
jgi:hypothetical protein